MDKNPISECQFVGFQRFEAVTTGAPENAIFSSTEVKIRA